MSRWHFVLLWVALVALRLPVHIDAVKFLRRFRCPLEDGKTKTFSLRTTQEVTLKKNTKAGTLCTLSIEQEDGSSIPVARSYDGNSWERAGGSFAAALEDWDCGRFRGCKAKLPKAAKYVLHTRIAPELKLFNGKLIRLFSSPSKEKTMSKAEVARFLESASFGATPGDLTTWGRKTFAQYVKEQFLEKPTYHREYFRRRANPRWTFHKPEFAAHLDPCVNGSTWRRQIITVKDTGKMIKLRRISGRWELSIDGFVRAIVTQLRFDSSPTDEKDEINNEGSYRYCSREEETLRGIYKLSVNGKCRVLISEDLTIDFPNDFLPPAVLNGTLAVFSDEQLWQTLSNRAIDGYVALANISSKLCANLPAVTIPPGPIFAKTIDGVWLQHDPRIQMQDSTLAKPWDDGGAESWLANRTFYCSNVPRSFLNEATCRMSNKVTCRPGSNDKFSVATGLLICGSPGEVENDLSLGDSWMDVSSITITRTAQAGIKLPIDTTSREAFARQRETIWSDVILTSKDQLRQRMALSLLHIFSLPKTAIVAEQQHTEYFLQYYDIFVRHAFGNYRDILREVSYSPLMAESLTYLGSKAVAALFARTKIVIFPDENFSRELMQLFTIGLVELNMDGSFALDANKQPISVYNTDDVMSFARAWTGFERSSKRANIEATENLNRIDPLKIEARFRDRFPKTDLDAGFIGDFYPLCIDLPDKPFLRVGAKYRLLGKSPQPELVTDDWKISSVTKTLRVQRDTSGLYEKLCAGSSENECSYPSVVVIQQNLQCEANAPECRVDTVRVIQVDDVYFEYERQSCVNLAFYNDGQKVAGFNRGNQPMCANPGSPIAGEACCEPSNFATPACVYAGERMMLNTAKKRCEFFGRMLCDYRNFTISMECPHIGYRWTSVGCKVKVKIREDGQVAIVHDLANTPASVSNTTQNYFIAYWKDKVFPRSTNGCDGGECQQIDDSCICSVDVAGKAVFDKLPSGTAEILEILRVGHAVTETYDTSTFVTKAVNGYRYHSSTQSCCNSDTVFEVTDPNGVSRFLKNTLSTVRVVGTGFEFRNPPMFNSPLASEFSVADARAETEAVLDHLFYHKNTPPFLALRFIQRFGISNPSPRYILAVATAFHDGVYSKDKISFGSGKYGDLRATIAAVLLDRDARSVVLDNDPAHGGLREPILKVLAFMRAAEFTSTVPLVELHLMDEKVGQMAYEQTSVFSFFRPLYSPIEIVSLGLVAPEVEVMSSGRVVGILNGLFSLIKYGLVDCSDGFGVFGACSLANSSGILSYRPVDSRKYEDVLRDLSTLLTSGRIDDAKSKTIVAALSSESNPARALQLAMQLIVASPEFHTTNRIDPRPPMKRPVPPQITPIQQPGYKAVIHLALVGGCDSFNVLVPGSSCTSLYQEYKLMRGSIALNTSDVLPLTGNNGAPQSCDSFTIHNGLPIIQKLYNGQDLLFMANVGVLTAPCNKDNCQVKTETQLFAHNTMQDEINSLDPFNVAAGTSPLGRMSDVLQTKGYATGRTAVESTPASLGGRSIIAPAIVTLDQTGVKPFNVNPTTPTMNAVIQQINGESSAKSGVYGEVWSSLLRRSLDQNVDLVSLLDDKPTMATFPDTVLGARLKLVAQLIANRLDRGVNRDFFFVPFDGFDMHSEVTISLQEKFLELNNALEVFVTELKQLGVWDNVVVIQSSDFGRTLTENTSGGTDHGWGGHYWMMGGGVKGQQIVGRYPDALNTDGALNWDRGRFIPTTPWDSVFNAVAEWVGVQEYDLNVVLPNRQKFGNLFAAGDLFSNNN